MIIWNPAPRYGIAVAMLAVFALTAVSRAQTTATSSEAPSSAKKLDKADELEDHLDQLTAKLESMRQQLKESQSEMAELRAELNSLRAKLAEKNPSEEAATAAATLRGSVEQLREQTDILQAEVKQHDETKVESGTKYPVRISGTLLFTSLVNGGNSDNIDLPTVALPGEANAASGSQSATVRQTVLSVTGSGPHLWGAKASAELSIDFFGGLPYTDYNTAAGSVRFRTGRAGLEWPDRSIEFAFDRPLISPWQPTSWLSVGEPALAWSGNLWTWVPQLRFKENGILPHGRLSAEFGLMDPAAPGPPATNGQRQPDASERSRQPGFEARVGTTLSWREHPINLGTGGYYSRQSYTYSRHVDAWAATADWNVFLPGAVELSGVIYRGRAIGGLGGGAFKDYVPYASYRSLRGLNDEGGWAQMKFMLLPSLEANVAAGQDNALAQDLRNSDLATEPDIYANLARNQNVFGNLVFRPRPYFLLSAEFRRLQSWTIAGDSNRDRIFGLAAGYSF
jgi:regulator of replication initiation timing